MARKTFAFSICGLSAIARMDEINRPVAGCADIDDDAIELHVMGKMTDSPVRLRRASARHLARLDGLSDRVAHLSSTRSKASSGSTRSPDPSFSYQTVYPTLRNGAL